jgi:hypothetical protein
MGMAVMQDTSFEKKGSAMDEAGSSRLLLCKEEELK